ncbi:MAG: hypothetical protein AB7O52_08500 [Planctomycetota bacterium]
MNRRRKNSTIPGESDKAKRAPNRRRGAAPTPTPSSLAESTQSLLADTQRLASARAQLAAIREPLFADMDALDNDPTYEQPPEPHRACTRAHNRMRISTLEALDIILAFRDHPKLRSKWPSIRIRIAAARARLRNDERRQAYDCPLLEGTLCTVHHIAKPIPCLAWNPGMDFTEAGWNAFAERDQLNATAVAEDWELKAIPVMLTHAAAALGIDLRDPLGTDDSTQVAAETSSARTRRASNPRTTRTQAPRRPVSKPQPKSRAKTRASTKPTAKRRPVDP